MPIAIYSAGRVGSTALAESLEAVDLFVFKPEMIANEEQRKQYGNAAWFYDHVLQPRRPAHIITLVRDPMAQMITEFFSKLNWITGERKVWETRTLPELIDLFNTAYFAQARHYYRLNWFEAEFEQTLGIDAYSYPFDTEQGYTRFSSDPYDVLILQLEMDNDLRERVVGEFVSVPELKILRTNTSEAKSFAAVYKQFKQELIVTPANLETVYGSRYATHFYSTAFIAKQRERWS